MKTQFLIIAVLYTFLGFSQPEERYVLLDSLTSKYKVEKYTLSTKSLYGVDTEIELYNVIRGEMLLLISILPDLEENKPKWQEVKWQDIENETISAEKITSLIIRMMYPTKSEDYLLNSKVLNRFFLIKKEKNKYYKAHFSLFEWFYVVEFVPYINVSQTKNSILNLGQKPLKRIDFKNADNLESSFFIPVFLRNIYLSAIEEKNNEKIYRFWTLDAWSVADGYNSQRGIDRFAYIPEKGIVGGSYDFYFSFKNPWTGKKNKIDIKLTPEQWEENRKQEKIMWAKELFPERQ